MVLNKNLLLLFGISTIMIVLAKELFGGFLFKDNVLLLGNFVLFALAAASDLMMRMGAKSKSNMGFMNAFYGSFLMKFMVVAIATCIYVFTTNVPNKFGLLALFPLYILYSVIGVHTMRTTLKNKS
jgi:hypothetical protein